MLHAPHPKEKGFFGMAVELALLLRNTVLSLEAEIALYLGSHVLILPMLTEPFLYVAAQKQAFRFQELLFNRSPPYKKTSVYWYGEAIMLWIHGLTQARLYYLLSLPVHKDPVLNLPHGFCLLTHLRELFEYFLRGSNHAPISSSAPNIVLQHHQK